MKTNKFWSMMMMFVLMLGTAIAFSSCGKDDDNDKKTGIDQDDIVVSSKEPYIGTWNNADSAYDQDYEILVFNADGTGSRQTIDQGQAHRVHTFTYTYRKDMIITIDDDDDEVETYTIVKATANALTIMDEDGDVCVYNRGKKYQEDSAPSASIVGTWSDMDSEYDRDYEIVVFNADGTGYMQNIDQGQPHRKHYFTYTYKNNVIVMIDDEDGYVDSLNVLQITGNSMRVKDVDGYTSTFYRK